MPLPVTPSYEHCLRELCTVSEDTAQLAARIAVELHPQVVSTSPAALQTQLFHHMHAIGSQQSRCVSRLAGWLNTLARQGGLSHKQAATFLNEAAALAGPSGVIPD
ncbi:hypothetical protein [Pseudomonas kulmbachensis]|uniref:hypothetical protein n=1 Tax=Pseudomonas kulmbachensis TaxID=3043408 RepID=UPI002AB2474B|nr:hypothetical protein [Pseudomonas sp. FLM 004-28]